MNNFTNFVFSNYHDNDCIVNDDCSEGWLTKKDLENKVNIWCSKLPTNKSLIISYINNKVESLAFFLACLKCNQCIALLDNNLPDKTKNQLNEKYSPNFIFHENEGSYVLSKFSNNDQEIYNENVLLLSTSGSTGSPKFVVLSNDNFLHNALKIAKILEIDKNSVAAAYLPFHYSYGLSVITSHLVVGAKVSLSNLSIMQSDFWKKIEQDNVSHFPGVPFHYETMLKLGLNRLNLSNINTMTQAGGHLSSELRQKVYDYMDQKKKKFYIMYGQTEASPRITTLKHDDFKSFPNSVGEVLEDGVITIDNSHVNELGFAEGEIIYSGPNVMLGYAENRSDLSRELTNSRKIKTGDIGYLDRGKLFITGRIKRFAKIYGLRVNLDEIQNALNEGSNNYAALSGSDSLRIFCEGSFNKNIEEYVTDLLLERFTIPLKSISVKFIKKIPVNSRGKIIYSELA